MNDSPRYVWHCDGRLTDECKKHFKCRGTDCNNYRLKDGSYAIEKQYLKKERK